jgi:acetyl-CoA carboxylase biotin carboxyl carrier protein
MTAPDRSSGDDRTSEERLADHAAIERLANELLPSLVAKLGASGLGELDVREDRWRVRLRMAGDGRPQRPPAGPGVRTAGRAPGHGGTGHATPPHLGARHHPPGELAAGHGAPAGGSAPARRPGAPASRPEASPAEAPPPEARPPAAPKRAVATSPAVGFFRPRADLAVGARLRAGDLLGTVDVLGVPHEVVAPLAGVLGASLVASGEPVEYGQPVMEIELLDAPPGERAEAG